MMLKPSRLAASAVVAAVLVVTWRVNYLLFHTSAELFSIVVGFASFLVAWYGRHWTGRNYLLLLGIGQFAVCFLDALHVMSYRGVNILGTAPGAGSAFWLSGRMLEAAVFLVAVCSPRRRWNTQTLLLVVGGVAVSAAIAIFTGWFPKTWEPGQGLTLFKSLGEIVVVLLFCCVFWRLVALRRDFDSGLYPLLLACVLVKVLTELPFVWYMDVTGLAHLVGHLLKIGGAWLFLMAVVEPALKRPHALVFGALEREKGLSDAVIRQAATLNAVLEASVNPVFMWTRERRIQFLSRAAEGFFGRSAAEAENLHWRELGLPSELMEPLDNLCREVELSGTPRSMEIRLSGRMGQPMLEVTASPVRGEDLDGTVVVLHDITVRRAMQDDLQQSVKDNSTLMAEVHHRVKNNLQIVSSLLQMQGWRVPDPELRTHFEEACGRILTLAKTHELLYRQGSASAVDFLRYLRLLCTDLFRFHGIADGRVLVDIPDGNVPLPVDKAEPLALIAHELIGSALRQAFEDRGGVLSLRLNREANGLVTLIVADNGTPTRPMQFEGDGASLGFRMVGVLVRQLNGALTVQQNPGTWVEIRFALPQ